MSWVQRLPGVSRVQRLWGVWGLWGVWRLLLLPRPLVVVRLQVVDRA